MLTWKSGQKIRCTFTVLYLEAKKKKYGKGALASCVGVAQYMGKWYGVELLFTQTLPGSNYFELQYNYIINPINF